MASFGPTAPITYMPPAPTGSSGGGWKFNAAKGIWEFVKDNAGDILSTTGGLIEGYMSSQDRAKQLAELQRQYDESLKQRQSEYDRNLAEQQATRNQSSNQFERTTGDAEAQAAVRAQTQLNAAPIADKAQALLLARMGAAPGEFQGRDLTKGVDDLRRMPAGPSAPVTTAMQTAAKNYQPGQGGVDTSTVKMLLEKMKASGFRPPATSTDPTTRTPPPPGTRPRFPLDTPKPFPEPPADHPSYEPPSDEPDQEPDNDGDDSITRFGVPSVLRRRMGLMT